MTPAEKAQRFFSRKLPAGIVVLFVMGMFVALTSGYKNATERRNASVRICKQTHRLNYKPLSEFAFAAYRARLSSFNKTHSPEDDRTQRVDYRVYRDFRLLLGQDCSKKYPKPSFINL